MRTEPSDPARSRAPVLARARATLAPLAVEYAAMLVLLFAARYLAQGYLAVRMDQECHLGGIAVDLLAHGPRFPLMVYAPNQYDNGTFVSGALTAIGFAITGPNVLVPRLVTHAVVTAGAVASLHLARGCLRELGWDAPWQRRLALGIVVLATALAPPLVTMRSMYGIGNHPEGAAIDAVLLALFASGVHRASAARTAALWALVGLALYVNKGTTLVLPILGVADAALQRPRLVRWPAALAGLALGLVPEILVIAAREGRGWQSIADKGSRGAASFPRGILTSLWNVSHHRVELLALWAIAIGVAIAIARRERGATLRMVLALSLLHLVALAVMARDFMDIYVLYGYPTIVVLLGIAAVEGARRLERARPGSTRAACAGIVALVAVAHRPQAIDLGLDDVARLARDRTGAVCSWRFAEGFGREYDFGGEHLGATREEHVIARCRQLTTKTQIAECIGGIAREIWWRDESHTPPRPPAVLGDVERRTYAYHYGTHRNGDARDCADFIELDLQAECASAVRLECLAFADAYTRYTAGRPIGRPSCTIDEPPDDAFWASMRRDLVAREPGSPPSVPEFEGPDSLARCAPTLRACYGEPD